jgi:hypothetical protein
MCVCVCVCLCVCVVCVCVCVCVRVCVCVKVRFLQRVTSPYIVRLLGVQKVESDNPPPSPSAGY